MFHRCDNEEEAKKLFRRLAKHLHPDAGGESDLMILLQESYELTYEFLTEKNKSDYRHYPNEEKRKYPSVHCEVRNGESCLEIISEILKYSEKNKKFDPTFVNELAKKLEEIGCLTAKQYNSLVKIYYAFKMDRDKT